MTSARIFNGVVLSILATLAVRPAAADPSGFYADVDLGQAWYPYSTVIDSHGVALSAVNHSTKDTSWGGIIGYRFTPYFGSEAGFVNLGKGTAPLSDASGATAAQGEARFTSKGPTLALTGAVQLANLEAYLRLGYLFAHTDLSIVAANGATKLNTAVSTNTAAPFAGVGLRYAFNTHWHLKIELDRYNDVGDRATTGTAYIDVATLGVGCRF